ncbi:hypothetical protein [Streptomonospora salina]|uniref:Uncharacterized protein n=1 Tax=Streptomonospora salina TaxID=104205 RepID=A0A841EBE5_9ACTN|nr:hypothetical protein [Streptomonospora salina]MBB6000306.1 hypothetical protein [Streptomonospora salina]
MSMRVPVHGRFTADWQRFAYAPFETPGVHVAERSADGSAYTEDAELVPPEGERWSAPEFQGGRLWFSAQQGGVGGVGNVYFLEIDDDGGGYSDDRTFEVPSVPEQAVPSPDRSRLLVHDDTAWYGIDPDAEPGAADRLFDVVTDGSREGYPLVAGRA